MNILILVSHVDDEVLGCGGWIPQLSKRNRILTVFLTDGKLHPPKKIDNREDCLRASKILGLKETDIFFLGLKTQRYDGYTLIDINKKVETLVSNQDFHPDMVITNSPLDVNHDHSVTFEVAKILARPINRQIKFLTCEVLSSVEWNDRFFEPNFYVNIEKTIDIKKKAMGCYKYELRKFPHPRSIEGIEVKAKQRGMEVGWNYAEAYHIVRWFL